MFSFLSSPLIKVLFITNLAFFASTAGFAYYSYQIKGDLAVAEERLQIVSDANLSLQNSLKQQELSCKADDVAVVELEAEKRELSEKVASLNERISALSKKSPLIIQEKSNETPNQSDYVDNSSKLSPELASLLTEAYCSVEPDDSRCTIRQSSNPSM